MKKLFKIFFKKKFVHMYEYRGPSDKALKDSSDKIDLWCDFL